MPSITAVPVKVNTQGFDLDLSAQAAIATNYEALSDGIATNPGRFAVWAVLEAQARKIHDLLVAKLEVIEAELFEQYRESVKSPVDAIKACVNKDPKRVAMVEEVIEAKSNMEMLKVGKSTMEHKKDSLLALASNMRAEMNAMVGGKINVSDRQQRELQERAARGSRGPGAPTATKGR